MAEEVRSLQRELEKTLEKKKKSLDKKEKEEGEGGKGGGDDSSEEGERVMDLLQALERIKFTPALIVSSKIANTINAVKKEFSPEVKAFCKKLIQKWKMIYAKGTSSSSSSSASQESNDTKNSTPPPSSSQLQRGESSSSISSDADEVDCEKMIASYPEGRKKIIGAIADSLSLDENGKKISNPVAFPLGCGVEAEINDMFSFHSDPRGYENKARKIFFSLKKNSELRQDLLDGRLTVANLLQLPSEMLATRAKREQAQKEREDIMMAKRNDYFQITRDETMRENGLDPNAGGEHKCSRCKGQKTSSYSLQTRSADEPMTVFVTCLTCGKRWRC